MDDEKKKLIEEVLYEKISAKDLNDFIEKIEVKMNLYNKTKNPVLKKEIELSLNDFITISVLKEVFEEDNAYVVVERMNNLLSNLYFNSCINNDMYESLAKVVEKAIGEFIDEQLVELQNRNTPQTLIKKHYDKIKTGRKEAIQAAGLKAVIEAEKKAEEEKKAEDLKEGYNDTYDDTLNGKGGNRKENGSDAYNEGADKGVYYGKLDREQAEKDMEEYNRTHDQTITETIEENTDVINEITKSQEEKIKMIDRQLIITPEMVRNAEEPIKDHKQKR